MIAQILLEDLTDIGVKLWVESTKLKAAPASRIPPEYVHAIRSHKAELMALLGATDTCAWDNRIRCASCKHLINERCTAWPWRYTPIVDTLRRCDLFQSRVVLCSEAEDGEQLQKQRA